MGWETRQRGTRQRGTRYYTRSRKVDGRVVREYVGTGARAQRAAHLDEAARAQRRAEVARWRIERERRDAIEQALVSYCAQVNELMRRELRAAGFHQHARGEWRRKRMTGTAVSTTGVARGEVQEHAAPPTEVAAAETQGLAHSYVELTAPEMTLAGMNATERTYIQDLAEGGDAAALKVIFRTMLADPERGNRLLNLAQQTRRALLAATFREENSLACESYLTKADMVEASLAREASGSALEHLLIERVVTCWLAAELADLDAAEREAAQEAYPRLNQSGVLNYYAQRQDRAHRRFLQAVEALNRMRRLLSPMPLMAGQVNIAQTGAQQLNIAQPATMAQVGSAGKCGSQPR